MPHVELVVLILEREGSSIGGALEKDGHRVLLARDAAHARSLVRGSLVDAVILDVDDRAHYSLAGELRRTHLVEPAVVVAVAAIETTIEHAHPLIDLFLTRPLELHLLSGLLHFLRDRRRHH